jgi:hypothetical protein
MLPLMGSIFLSGMGSAVEIYPSPVMVVITRPDPNASDADRIASDWRRVGQALSNAIEAEVARGEEGK